MRVITALGLGVGLILLAGLVGCGSSGPAPHDPALVGTWHANSATIDGAAATLKDAFNEDYAMDASTITFRADGTATQTNSNGGTVMDTIQWTWQAENGTLNLKSLASTPPPITYVFAGGQMTTSWDDDRDTGTVHVSVVWGP